MTVNVPGAGTNVTLNPGNTGAGSPAAAAPSSAGGGLDANAQPNNGGLSVTIGGSTASGNEPGIIAIPALTVPNIRLGSDTTGGGNVDAGTGIGGLLGEVGLHGDGSVVSIVPNGNSSLDGDSVVNVAANGTGLDGGSAVHVAAIGSGAADGGLNVASSAQGGGGLLPLITTTSGGGANGGTTSKAKGVVTLSLAR